MARAATKPVAAAQPKASVPTATSFRVAPQAQESISAIVQTPKEVLVIHEGSGRTVRELSVDGRPLPPKDVEPWWNGYTVARWDGDTLVAETTGLMDDAGRRTGGTSLSTSPIPSRGLSQRLFSRALSTAFAAF